MDVDSEWEIIDDSHPLMEPPAQVAPPLPVAAPLKLNLGEVAWDSFEHLVAAVVREVEGAWEARVYGRRGQAQQGIDVAGLFDGQKPRVYQAKRYGHFAVADLTAAVTIYAQGNRPFGADHLVIVTSADVSDTKLDDELDRLRRQHSDLKIELWGCRQLSDKLVDHPRIVRRFFGEATADLFCQPSAAHLPRPAAAPPAGSLPPDAIVRGPVAHLKKTGLAEQADALRNDSPAQAADLYGQVADALQDAKYSAHAVHMRRQQAACLHEAGDLGAGLAADLDVMRGDLEAGEPGLALSVSRRLEQGQVEVPDEWGRQVDALGALAAYEHEHDLTTVDIAEHIDALQDGDAVMGFAVTRFAEHALAEHRPDLVADRMVRLTAAAAASEPGSLEQARLHACLADAGHDNGWENLGLSIRTTYEPRAAALLFARYARHLIRQQKPKPALSFYNQAIDLAVDQSAFGDAAEWLHSQDLVKARFGLIVPYEFNEGYRRIVTVRSAGAGSVMPAAFSVRERALSKMQNASLPDAAHALRAYRTRSATLGDWSGEQEAEQLLGVVQQRADQPARALRHHLAAGDLKGIDAAAESLPEVPFDFPVPDGLLDDPNWQRAAAYQTVVATADLLPDSTAQQWAGVILEELVLGRPVPSRTTSAVQTAFTAFARLAAATTSDQAQRFLALTEPLLNREPDAVHRSDNAHADALIEIAGRHSGHRHTAIEHLCRALLASDYLARRILNRGMRALALEPDTVTEHCAAPAVDGNTNAALAIVLSGSDTSPAQAAARHLLPVPLPDNDPGLFPRQGLTTLSLLAPALELPDRTAVADACAQHALNRNDAAFQRREALHALATLATHLDDTVRDRHFSTALDFALGSQDGSADDDLPNGPFDRFRFNLGPTTLRPDGLVSAACLAHTAEQTAQVTQRALSLLIGADEDLIRSTVQALFQVPLEQLTTLDPAVLAIHSDPWIRVLAAALWCAHPGIGEELGRALVGDSSRHVRRLLGLRTHDDGLRARLREDPRRSVRLAISQHQTAVPGRLPDSVN
jgi:hypothetical protein